MDAGSKKWIEQGMEGFLVRNLESYAALKKCGYGDKCVLDSSLYTWNDEATEFWKKRVSFATQFRLN